MDGVDETPEWNLRMEIARDICAACEQWQALQDGLIGKQCSAICYGRAS